MINILNPKCANDQKYGGNVGQDNSEDTEVSDEQLINESRQQVKKMTSETSSFHVIDLKPDTSYNLMIYVINSKGRFYQASTLPADIDSSKEANSSGQVQFINKKPADAASSLAEKLNHYFKNWQRLLQLEQSKAPNKRSNDTNALLSNSASLSLCAFVVEMTEVATKTAGTNGDRKREPKMLRRPTVSHQRNLEFMSDGILFLTELFNQHLQVRLVWLL